MTTEEDRLYDEEATRLNKELRPRLTDSFLDTLVFAARTYGHRGDYSEIMDFVFAMYGIADKRCSWGYGKPLPPFQD
jgi:hypothetical protein